MSLQLYVLLNGSILAASSPCKVARPGAPRNSPNSSPLWRASRSLYARSVYDGQAVGRKLVRKAYCLRCSCTLRVMRSILSGQKLTWALALGESPTELVTQTLLQRNAARRSRSVSCGAVYQVYVAPGQGRDERVGMSLPYLRHSTRRFGLIGLLLYHPGE